VQGAVPLGHRLEVRADEPLDVVADPVGQLGRVLDDEPGAAVQRPPDPERDREAIAAFDPPVAGLSSPSVARSPLVSIRWQESGIPFHSSRATASSSRRPGSSPRISRRTPLDGPARRVLERRQLLGLVDHA
jgi:hypothetical protein